MFESPHLMGIACVDSAVRFLLTTIINIDHPIDWEMTVVEPTYIPSSLIEFWLLYQDTRDKNMKVHLVLIRIDDIFSQEINKKLIIAFVRILVDSSLLHQINHSQSVDRERVLVQGLSLAQLLEED